MMSQAIRRRHDALKENYEIIKLFNLPMLFVDLRIDALSVPKGLCVYEVGYDDDNIGNPDVISSHIICDFFGTLITPYSLDFSDKYLFLYCRKEWKWCGKTTSLEGWIQTQGFNKLIQKLNDSNNEGGNK